MAKDIPGLIVQDLDFARLARSDNATVFRHFIGTRGQLKKDPFKKGPINCYRVTRTARAVTLELMLDKKDGNELKVVGTYQVVPVPPFA